MSNVKMFGIKNCDTIKKAQKWLTENGIEFHFHDYRKDGLDQAWLTEMVQHFGWETILNKRGTTYRQLDQAIKDNLNEQTAIEQLMLNPAMIKRPILIDTTGQAHIGFKADQYSTIFGKA